MFEDTERLDDEVLRDALSKVFGERERRRQEIERATAATPSQRRGMPRQGITPPPPRAQRSEIARYIIRRAHEMGFSPQEIGILLTIANIESSFNPHTTGDGGKSYGLFQINVARMPKYGLKPQNPEDVRKLYDWRYNTELALRDFAQLRDILRRTRPEWLREPDKHFPDISWAYFAYWNFPARLKQVLSGGAEWVRQNRGAGIYKLVTPQVMQQKVKEAIEILQQNAPVVAREAQRQAIAHVLPTIAKVTEPWHAILPRLSPRTQKPVEAVQNFMANVAPAYAVWRHIDDTRKAMQKALGERMYRQFPQVAASFKGVPSDTSGFARAFLEASLGPMYEWMSEEEKKQIRGHLISVLNEWNKKPVPPLPQPGDKEGQERFAQFAGQFTRDLFPVMRRIATRAMEMEEELHGETALKHAGKVMWGIVRDTAADIVGMGGVVGATVSSMLPKVGARWREASNATLQYMLSKLPTEAERKAFTKLYNKLLSDKPLQNIANIAKVFGHGIGRLLKAIAGTGGYIGEEIIERIKKDRPQLAKPIELLFSRAGIAGTLEGIAAELARDKKFRGAKLDDAVTTLLLVAPHEVTPQGTPTENGWFLYALNLLSHYAEEYFNVHPYLRGDKFLTFMYRKRVEQVPMIGFLYGGEVASGVVGLVARGAFRGIAGAALKAADRMRMPTLAMREALAANIAQTVTRAIVSPHQAVIRAVEPLVHRGIMKALLMTGRPQRWGAMIAEARMPAAEALKKTMYANDWAINHAARQAFLLSRGMSWLLEGAASGAIFFAPERGNKRDFISGMLAGITLHGTMGALHLGANLVGEMFKGQSWREAWKRVVEHTTFPPQLVERILRDTLKDVYHLPDREVNRLAREVAFLYHLERMDDVMEASKGIPIPRTTQSIIARVYARAVAPLTGGNAQRIAAEIEEALLRAEKPHEILRSLIGVSSVVTKARLLQGYGAQQYPEVFASHAKDVMEAVKEWERSLTVAPDDYEQSNINLILRVAEATGRALAGISEAMVAEERRREEPRTIAEPKNTRGTYEVRGLWLQPSYHAALFSVLHELTVNLGRSMGIRRTSSEAFVDEVLDEFEKMGKAIDSGRSVDAERSAIRFITSGLADIYVELRTKGEREVIPEEEIEETFNRLLDAIEKPFVDFLYVRAGYKLYGDEGYERARERVRELREEMKNNAKEEGERRFLDVLRREITPQVATTGLVRRTTEAGEEEEEWAGEEEVAPEEAAVRFDIISALRAAREEAEEAQNEAAIDIIEALKEAAEKATRRTSRVSFSEIRKMLVESVRSLQGRERSPFRKDENAETIVGKLLETVAILNGMKVVYDDPAELERVIEGEVLPLRSPKKAYPRLVIFEAFEGRDRNAAARAESAESIMRDKGFNTVIHRVNYPWVDEEGRPMVSYVVLGWDKELGDWNESIGEDGRFLEGTPGDVIMRGIVTGEKSLMDFPLEVLQGLRTLITNTKVGDLLPALLLGGYRQAAARVLDIPHMSHIAALTPFARVARWLAGEAESLIDPAATMSTYFINISPRWKVEIFRGPFARGEANYTFVPLFILQLDRDAPSGGEFKASFPVNDACIMTELLSRTRGDTFIGGWDTFMKILQETRGTVEPSQLSGQGPWYIPITIRISPEELADVMQAYLRGSLEGRILGTFDEYLMHARKWDKRISEAVKRLGEITPEKGKNALEKSTAVVSPIRSPELLGDPTFGVAADWLSNVGAGFVYVSASVRDILSNMGVNTEEIVKMFEGMQIGGVNLSDVARVWLQSRILVSPQVARMSADVAAVTRLSIVSRFVPTWSEVLYHTIDPSVLMHEFLHTLMNLVLEQSLPAPGVGAEWGQQIRGMVETCKELVNNATHQEALSKLKNALQREEVELAPNTVNRAHRVNFFTRKTITLPVRRRVSDAELTLHMLGMLVERAIGALGAETRAAEAAKGIESKARALVALESVQREINALLRGRVTEEELVRGALRVHSVLDSLPLEWREELAPLVEEVLNRWRDIVVDEAIRRRIRVGWEELREGEKEVSEVTEEEEIAERDASEVEAEEQELEGRMEGRELEEEELEVAAEEGGEEALLAGEPEVSEEEAIVEGEEEVEEEAVRMRQVTSPLIRRVWEGTVMLVGRKAVRRWGETRIVPLYLITPSEEGMRKAAEDAARFAEAVRSVAERGIDQSVVNARFRTAEPVEGDVTLGDLEAQLDRVLWALEEALKAPEEADDTVISGRRWLNYLFRRTALVTSKGLFSAEGIVEIDERIAEMKEWLKELSSLVGEERTEEGKRRIRKAIALMGRNVAKLERIRGYAVRVSGAFDDVNEAAESIIGTLRSHPVLQLLEQLRVLAEPQVRPREAPGRVAEVRAWLERWPQLEGVSAVDALYAFRAHVDEALQAEGRNRNLVELHGLLERAIEEIEDTRREIEAINENEELQPSQKQERIEKRLLKIYRIAEGTLSEVQEYLNRAVREEAEREVAEQERLAATGRVETAVETLRAARQKIMKLQGDFASTVRQLLSAMRSIPSQLSDEEAAERVSVLYGYLENIRNLRRELLESIRSMPIPTEMVDAYGTIVEVGGGPREVVGEAHEALGTLIDTQHRLQREVNVLFHTLLPLTGAIENAYRELSAGRLTPEGARELLRRGIRQFAQQWRGRRGSLEEAFEAQLGAVISLTGRIPVRPFEQLEATVRRLEISPEKVREWLMGKEEVLRRYGIELPSEVYEGETSREVVSRALDFLRNNVVFSGDLEALEQLRALNHLANRVRTDIAEAVRNRGKYEITKPPSPPERAARQVLHLVRPDMQSLALISGAKSVISRALSALPPEEKQRLGIALGKMAMLMDAGVFESAKRVDFSDPRMRGLLGLDLLTFALLSDPFSHPHLRAALSGMERMKLEGAESQREAVRWVGGERGAEQLKQLFTREPAEEPTEGALRDIRNYTVAAFCLLDPTTVGMLDVSLSKAVRALDMLLNVVGMVPVTEEREEVRQSVVGALGALREEARRLHEIVRPTSTVSEEQLNAKIAQFVEAISPGGAIDRITALLREPALRESLRALGIAPHTLEREVLTALTDALKAIPSADAVLVKALIHPRMMTKAVGGASIVADIPDELQAPMYYVPLSFMIDEGIPSIAGAVTALAGTAQYATPFLEAATVLLKGMLSAPGIGTALESSAKSAVEGIFTKSLLPVSFRADERLAEFHSKRMKQLAAFLGTYVDIVERFATSPQGRLLLEHLWDASYKMAEAALIDPLLGMRPTPFRLPIPFARVKKGIGASGQALTDIAVLDALKRFALRAREHGSVAGLAAAMKEVGKRVAQLEAVQSELGTASEVLSALTTTGEEGRELRLKLRHLFSDFLSAAEALPPTTIGGSRMLMELFSRRWLRAPTRERPPIFSVSGADFIHILRRIWEGDTSAYNVLLRGRRIDPAVVARVLLPLSFQSTSSLLPFFMTAPSPVAWGEMVRDFFALMGQGVSLAHLGGMVALPRGETAPQSSEPVVAVRDIMRSINLGVEAASGFMSASLDSFLDKYGITDEAARLAFKHLFAEDIRAIMLTGNLPLDPLAVLTTIRKQVGLEKVADAVFPEEGGVNWEALVDMASEVIAAESGLSGEALKRVLQDARRRAKHEVIRELEMRLNNERYMPVRASRILNEIAKRAATRDVPHEVLRRALHAAYCVYLLKGTVDALRGRIERGEISGAKELQDIFTGIGRRLIKVNFVNDMLYGRPTDPAVIERALTDRGVNEKVAEHIAAHPMLLAQAPEPLLDEIIRTYTRLELPLQSAPVMDILMTYVAEELKQTQLSEDREARQAQIASATAVGLCRGLKFLSDLHDAVVHNPAIQEARAMWAQAYLRDDAEGMAYWFGRMREILGEITKGVMGFAVDKPISPNNVESIARSFLQRSDSARVSLPLLSLLGAVAGLTTVAAYPPAWFALKSILTTIAGWNFMWLAGPVAVGWGLYELLGRRARTWGAIAAEAERIATQMEGAIQAAQNEIRNAVTEVIGAGRRGGAQEVGVWQEVANEVVDMLARYLTADAVRSVQGNFEWATHVGGWRVEPRVTPAGQIPRRRATEQARAGVLGSIRSPLGNLLSGAVTVNAYGAALPLRNALLRMGQLVSVIVGRKLTPELIQQILGQGDAYREATYTGARLQLLKELPRVIEEVRNRNPDADEATVMATIRNMPVGTLVVFKGSVGRGAARQTVELTTDNIIIDGQPLSGFTWERAWNTLIAPELQMTEHAAWNAVEQAYINGGFIAGNANTKALIRQISNIVRGRWRENLQHHIEQACIQLGRQPSEIRCALEIGRLSRDLLYVLSHLHTAAALANNPQFLPLFVHKILEMQYFANQLNRSSQNPNDPVNVLQDAIEGIRSAIQQADPDTYNQASELFRATSQMIQRGTEELMRSLNAGSVERALQIARRMARTIWTALTFTTGRRLAPQTELEKHMAPTIDVIELYSALMHSAVNEEATHVMDARQLIQVANVMHPSVVNHPAYTSLLQMAQRGVARPEALLKALEASFKADARRIAQRGIGLNRREIMDALNTIVYHIYRLTPNAAEWQGFTDLNAIVLDIIRTHVPQLLNIPQEELTSIINKAIAAALTARYMIIRNAAGLSLETILLMHPDILRLVEPAYYPQYRIDVEWFEKLLQRAGVMRRGVGRPSYMHERGGAARPEPAQFFERILQVNRSLAMKKATIGLEPQLHTLLRLVPEPLRPALQAELGLLLGVRSGGAAGLIADIVTNAGEGIDIAARLLGLHAERERLMRGLTEQNPILRAIAEITSWGQVGALAFNVLSILRQVLAVPVAAALTSLTLNNSPVTNMLTFMSEWGRLVGNLIPAFRRPYSAFERMVLETMPAVIARENQNLSWLVIHSQEALERFAERHPEAIAAIFGAGTTTRQFNNALAQLCHFMLMDRQAVGKLTQASLAALGYVDASIVRSTALAAAKSYLLERYRQTNGTLTEADIKAAIAFGHHIAVESQATPARTWQPMLMQFPLMQGLVGMLFRQFVVFTFGEAAVMARMARHLFGGALESISNALSGREWREGLTRAAGALAALSAMLIAQHVMNAAFLALAGRPLQELPVGYPARRHRRTLDIAEDIAVALGMELPLASIPTAFHRVFNLLLNACLGGTRRDIALVESMNVPPFLRNLAGVFADARLLMDAQTYGREIKRIYGDNKDVVKHSFSILNGLEYMPRAGTTRRRKVLMAEFLAYLYPFLAYALSRSTMAINPAVGAAVTAGATLFPAGVMARTVRGIATAAMTPTGPEAAGMPRGLSYLMAGAAGAPFRETMRPPVIMPPFVAGKISGMIAPEIATSRATALEVANNFISSLGDMDYLSLTNAIAELIVSVNDDRTANAAMYVTDVFYWLNYAENAKAENRYIPAFAAHIWNVKDRAENGTKDEVANYLLHNADFVLALCTICGPDALAFLVSKKGEDPKDALESTLTLMSTHNPRITNLIMRVIERTRNRNCRLSAEQQKAQIGLRRAVQSVVRTRRRAEQ